MPFYTQNDAGKPGAKPENVLTLQELKLHGRKICDGVAISRYPWAKSFANHLGTFLTL